MIPQLAENSIRCAPALPCLVVTRTTPLAPREPYIAVADASLRTSMFSMSLGLIIDNGLSTVLLPEFASLFGVPLASNGMPSITYSGCVLVLVEFAPRIVILIPAPGAPSLRLTCTPAILPCSPLPKSVGVPRISSSELMEAMAPVRSLLRIFP